MKFKSRRPSFLSRKDKTMTKEEDADGDRRSISDSVIKEDADNNSNSLLKVHYCDV